MAYRTRASQAASPSKAAGRCAIAPASVPKTKVQPTLIRTAALITAIPQPRDRLDRKSTRLNSSHANISYAVFCLKKNKKTDSVTLLLMLDLHPSCHLLLLLGECYIVL